jgi:DNA-binding transcriptional ArsR family regulator
VTRVLRQEQSVSALAARYRMSFAAVQKHVAVLERATLVSKERRGREQVVHGNVAALRRAAGLLADYEQIWRGRARAIEDLLAEEAPPGGRGAQ